MKSFIISVLFMGCVASSNAGLFSGFFSEDGEVIPGAFSKYWETVLREFGEDLDGDGEKLIDDLIDVVRDFDDALEKDDLKQFGVKFQEGSDSWEQMLPYVKSERFRQTTKSIIAVNNAMLKKFNAGTATWNDLNDFFTVAAIIVAAE